MYRSVDDSWEETVHYCGKQMMMTHVGYDASEAFRNRILLGIL